MFEFGYNKYFDFEFIYKNKIVSLYLYKLNL